MEQQHLHEKAMPPQLRVRSFFVPVDNPHDIDRRNQSSSE